MPKKKYSSGNPTAKSDFYVEFVPNNSGGVKIDIQSKTKVLHFSKIENSCQNTLADLKVKHGTLSVIDNGGQYFVLQARIELAVKSAHPSIIHESQDIASGEVVYISPEHKQSSCSMREYINRMQ